MNYEWNVKLTSHENGEIVHHFKNQFEEVWKDAQALTEQWIEEYEKDHIHLLNSINSEQVIELPINIISILIEEALKIVPNKMQQAAL